MAMISLQTAYDQARRWIESSDSERAISLAQHILEQYPENLEAYRILGEAYLASRQLDKAQGAFEQVLRSDPENIPAHVGIGITYERQGRLDKAVPEFEQAWEIKPDMTELRSQLLRLYTDAWGSEHAQLRLSRAGLARLYAKGHMLPQAITEFRHVIADNPGRYDAKVALAEALWRDGQEDAATRLAHDLLAEQPKLLKAHLLLGYIALAAGQPDGQQSWEAAHNMDPYRTVAQAMFDALPSDDSAEPMLEEWDEQAWLQQQRETREHEELAAATRPMPVATPVLAPQAEEDTFGAWFDQPTLPPPPAPRATSVHAGNQDDFLAGLLNMGGGTSAASTDVDELPVQPFSFDDAASTSSTSSATVQPQADEADMQPFSLADLGLDDDEIASFNAPSSAPATPPAPADDEPQMTPFSLADLGLDDDEIASFNAPSSAPATPPADDEPQMTPFSLADLGLDNDEIASLNEVSSVPTTPPAGDEPQMTPFSLADLGLDDDEIASLNEVSSVPTTPPADDEPQMTPFSLADLGLDDDEIASLNDLGASANTPADDEPQLTPFSLADLGLSDEEMAGLDSLSELSSTDAPEAPPRAQSPGSASSGTTEDANDFDELPVGLMPFSLDELDLSAEEDDDRSSSGGLPASLQPFSLDDASESSRGSGRAPEDTFAGLNLNVSDEDDSPAPTGGYSFRQPNQRTRPGFLKPKPTEAVDEGLSIFAKLKQRKQNEPVAPPEELPRISNNEPDQVLFSFDDVSLRDEAGAAPVNSAVQPSSTTPITPPADMVIPNAQPITASEPTPRVEATNLNEAMSSGQIQPFSLADLGLSDDEIAALGFGTAQTPPAPTEPEPVAPPVAYAEPAPTPPVAEAPQQSEPQSASVSDTVDFGDVQPFSFADLGLSDDEIASFGLEEPSAAPLAPAVEEPSAQVPASQSTDEPQPSTSNASVSDAVDFGDVQPFSFADLGLSDEEIASFGLGEPNASDATQSATPAPALDDTQLGATDPDDPLTSSELQPFSLTDLGFSDEEISGFDFGDNEEPSSAALGITEEDLAGLDLGELDWNQTPVSATPDEAFAPASLDPEPLDGDAVVERLIALGQLQGYVDVNDIITGVETPEAEEERIEEIINQLQAANIEIRDGDERIDLNADDEYEDDLSSIDFGTPATSMPESSVSDEPDMTPFSLADLGLSDDEIDALNLGESTPATPTSDEPDMTPFSLADLGLSDDEIDALNLGESTPATPTSDEPDMTPFSLADLGLDDDEISALNLGEATSATPTSDEPDMTPFSLADLGLDDDEIDALDLGESTPATPISDEPDMTPFSLADLGLSDDEISALNLGEATPATSTSDEPDMTPFSLADLGLSDDEIDALDLGEATPATPTSDKPDMTPFSLADLGLSDDEIDALDLGASAPATSPSSGSLNAEPDTTPLSLADLGLDDQTSTPNLGEPDSAAAAASGSASAEPDTSPFSLADLGLDDEPEATNAANLPVADPAAPAVQVREPAQPTEPIVAPPVVPSPPASNVAPAPTAPRGPSGSLPLTNNPAIDTYIRRLEAEPQNHVLRLAVARLVGQAGMVPLAIQQYKQLIRQNVLLDNVISELTDLLEEVDDQQTLQRLHRTIGDAYSKQGRIEQAIEEYSWLP